MTHSDRDASERPKFATGGPVRGPQHIIVNSGCLSGWAPLGTDDKGRSLGFTTTTTAPAGLPLHESADRDASDVPSDRQWVTVTLPDRILGRPWSFDDLRREAEWANRAGSGEAGDLIWAIANALLEQGLDRHLRGPEPTDAP